MLAVPYELHRKRVDPRHIGGASSARVANSGGPPKGGASGPTPTEAPAHPRGSGAYRGSGTCRGSGAYRGSGAPRWLRHPPRLRHPRRSRPRAGVWSSSPSAHRRGRVSGSQARSYAAGAGLQVGAMYVLGWSQEASNRRRFESLLAAASWIDAHLRLRSMEVEAMRARSPQHKVYGCIRVTEWTTYNLHIGPQFMEWWAPSGASYTLVPSVAIFDSEPHRAEEWSALAETGWGWYKDTRSFDVCFEIPAAAPQAPRQLPENTPPENTPAAVSAR